MLSKRFNEALTFAADLHATQTRKGSGVPYIAHLLGVASIALEYGAQEDEAIAALLHDAIEDQGGIATQKFAVALGIPSPRSWKAAPTLTPPRNRRGESAKKLTSPTCIMPLPLLYWSVRQTSCTAARSILQDYRVVGEQPKNRFKGGKSGTLWYYRSLVET